MINIAAWLKAARMEKGLTELQLARKAGYVKETINHLETGRRSGNFETISNIVEALGYEIRIERADNAIEK